MDEEQGYSGVFYIMLIIGIIGVLGFFIVAAGAAEPELPPRPGDDGVTWDDAFDWYHRNRDKCGSLKQLAALVAYDFGTVRNRHAEYQAQRK